MQNAVPNPDAPLDPSLASPPAVRASVVGPCDGLQRVAATKATADKGAWISAPHGARLPRGFGPACPGPAQRPHQGVQLGVQLVVQLGAHHG